jgi:hypothetical protein
MIHITHKTYKRRTRIQTAPNLISTLWQDSSGNQTKSFSGCRRQRYSSCFPSHLPGEGKEDKLEKSYTSLLRRTGKDKEYTICCLLRLDPKLDKCAVIRASESWRHLRQGGKKRLRVVKTYWDGQYSRAPFVMTTRSTALVEKSVVQERALLFSKTGGITTTFATYCIFSNLIRTLFTVLEG